MIVPTLFLATAAAAAACSTWAIVFVVAPSASRTRYRHRLWRIRDDMFDDMLAGRLTRSEPAERLLRAVRVGIAGVAYLTPAKALLFMVLNRRDRDPETFEEWLGLDAAPEEDRARLNKYYNRYQRAAVRHLALGSFSGVLTLLAVLVVAAFVTVAQALVHLVHRARPSALREFGRDDIEATIRVTFRVDSSPTPRAEVRSLMRSVVGWEVNLPSELADILASQEPIAV